ncbi:hypothetical protein Tco_0568902 [Tanacetum coccineum]
MVTNNNPSRGRMSPRSTIWGQAKGSLMGDLCPSAPSAISTTMARAPRGPNFTRDCPKLKNKDGGNRNAQGWVYAVGNLEKRGNTPGNLDANVVTVANGRESPVDSYLMFQKLKSKMPKMSGPFYAQISAKKEEDNRKKTDDGRTNRPDFPEVISRGLSRLPPARTREFLNRLNPAEPHTRSWATESIGPSEMKELSEQLQEILTRGFKRPRSSPLGELPVLFDQKEGRVIFRMSSTTVLFIEGFSKIAKSMTKLTQKGIKFDWGEQEENVFIIKQKLCSAANLALPEGSEDLLFALKIWRPQSIRTNALVFINHKELQPFSIEKELNRRQRVSRITSWTTIVNIRYHQESKLWADALAVKKERINHLRVRALVMTIGLDLPKRILEAQIEAQKPENLVNEDVGGIIRRDIPKERLEPRADGTLCYTTENNGKDRPIKQRLQAAISIDKKSSADRKQKPMEIQIGDKSYAQVSPVERGRTGSVKRSKAEPEIMSVSHVDDKLHFVEELVEIMEWEIKPIGSEAGYHWLRFAETLGGAPECHREREDSFKQKYPQLFINRASSSTTRS